MKRTTTNLIFLLLLITSSAVAQMPALERIEPANWWVGMKNTKLQLIVHGNQIAARNVTINYPGVTLLKTNKVENANYLFLDLEISASTQPGIFPIRFEKKGAKSICSLAGCRNGFADHYGWRFLFWKRLDRTGFE